LTGLTRVLRAYLAAIHFELIVLLLLGIMALGKGIDQAPLVDWDEATYAEVAHEAITNHSYVNLTWNGESYLKKPPLLFWAMTASFKLFGESEFSARLPSVIMGTGTLLLVCLMAAGVFGRLLGLLAGIIPLGFYYFVARGGREAATDAPLIFFSTLAIFALGRACYGAASQPLAVSGDRRWMLLAGGACGFAILSKGAAGLIPLAVSLIAMIALPVFSELGLVGVLYTFGAACAVAAPWFVYQAIHNGSVFWSVYIKDETLMRIVKHLEAKPAAAGSTWHTIIADLRFLRPLLLPLAGLVAVATQTPLLMVRRIPPLVLLWILWFAVAFTAALAVQTKLGWYVLPALIPVALLAAAIIAGAWVQTGLGAYYCRAFAVGALILLVPNAVRKWSQINSEFGLERARSRPGYEMAMRGDALAAIRGGGELYFAGAPLPAMVYYSRLRCHFVSPSEPEFELADLGGNPISVSYHELVLLDREGAVTAVDNLSDEWNRSGPEAERFHKPELEDSYLAPDVQQMPE
jgi:4-amino-4-deoxy-L-arabinose transferase-like glycosyltransferase